jgi:type VI secretion system protein ImpM
MTVEGPGFFGKLPGSGDFVSRGLSRPLIAGLDAWLHDGLAALPSRFGPTWLEHYLVAPAWSFVLPAGGWSPTMMLGAAIPSVDRVGRYFPLVALAGVPANTPLQACLPPASDWHAMARGLLLKALQEGMPPDDLIARLAEVPVYGQAPSPLSASDDDIMSILGDFGVSDAESIDARPDFSWPELPLLFEARLDRSFWWTEASAAQSARQVIHRGPLDTPLFAQLFGPLQLGWNDAV